MQSIGGTSTVKKQESTTYRKHLQKSGEISIHKEKEFDNPVVLSKQVITKNKTSRPIKSDPKGDAKAE